MFWAWFDRLFTLLSNNTKYSPRLFSFIDKSHSVQCMGDIECELSLVHTNHTTLVMKADENRYQKCWWPEKKYYFDLFSESDPDSIPWMLRFIRNILSTQSITASRYHCVESKENLKFLTHTRIVQTQTCVWHFGL